MKGKKLIAMEDLCLTCKRYKEGSDGEPSCTKGLKPKPKYGGGDKCARHIRCNNHD